MSMKERLKGLEEEANGVGKRLGQAQVPQHMVSLLKMKKYGGRSNTRLAREGGLLAMLTMRGGYGGDTSQELSKLGG